MVSTFNAHHWSNPTPALAELARVLRPGGQLRIYDIRGKTLAKLAAGPLPASSIAPSPPHGRRLVGLVLRAVFATFLAEKASESRLEAATETQRSCTRRSPHRGVSRGISLIERTIPVGSAILPRFHLIPAPVGAKRNSTTSPSDIT